MANDPMGRVACETLVTTGLALVAGEITTKCVIDYASIVRKTVESIGYTDANFGFDFKTCAVMPSVDTQSPDIAMDVDGGGPGDCGWTGRRILVASDGGMGRHGVGAFSGKDPTKVDRSACYRARYIAMNVVASGLADRVEIQLAYAIGVADPVSVSVDTFGTCKIDQNKIAQLVRENFQLTPRGIIESLDLRRPTYRK